MNRSFIGIEIGGTKLQVVLGSPKGEIIERQRYHVHRESGAQGILNQIEEALVRYCKDESKIGGIGVGFGGPVDRASGQIVCSHHINGWSDFPLKQWLHSLLGVPVIVDNDANVAALGESLAGAGEGSNPVFYVTLGSGVGGGAVIDGAIYHGAQPSETEIGHVRLDRSGIIVEQECSGWAVDQKIRKLIKKKPNSLLARLVGDQTANEAKYLNAALSKQCPLAQSILSDLSQSLAFALSHVIHLFHPEMIILGGGISLLGNTLLTSVTAELSQFVMETLKPGPKIRLAKLQEDVVPVGALLMAAKACSEPNS